MASCGPKGWDISRHLRPQSTLLNAQRSLRFFAESAAGCTGLEHARHMQCLISGTPSNLRAQSIEFRNEQICPHSSVATAGVMRCSLDGAFASSPPFGDSSDSSASMPSLGRMSAQARVGHRDRLTFSGCIHQLPHEVKDVQKGVQSSMRAHLLRKQGLGLYIFNAPKSETATGSKVVGWN